MTPLTRRHLLQRAALASGALALGPAFWQRAVAAAATVGDGPYGPLGPADANGIRLPQGFSARLVARGGEVVPGSGYAFPTRPDGQATFATERGGWILVTNAEAVPPNGGVSATRFDASGEVVDAYRILSGTTHNCSGGPTPWGTWLSCEEVDAGLVWECDPTQPSQGVSRPALGTFKHESAAVDSAAGQVYLTEDTGDGNLYRFTPDGYPSLEAGTLEVAVVDDDGRVTWAPIPEPNPAPDATPTRQQVPEAAKFSRAEGIWFDSGVVYLATTRDSKIHAYDTVEQRIAVIYDRATVPDPPLQNPDNLTVSPAGDLFVAEDNTAADGHLDVVILTPDRIVAPFLSLVGPKHIRDESARSELTGPVFDPSGTRLYVTSQRARASAADSWDGPGEVYEITGPFRVGRPESGPLSPGDPREPGQAVGSGQAQSPGAQVAGPALGVEVPRRIAWHELRRNGLPVAMTLDRPAHVDIRVFARFVPASQRSHRGATRHQFRLAEVARDVAEAGPQLIRLPFGPRAIAQLRGRRQALRLSVEVSVDQAALSRTTILGAPPHPPRRRARRRRA
jgi:uncharacterized protein